MMNKGGREVLVTEVGGGGGGQGGKQRGRPGGGGQGDLAVDDEEGRKECAGY